MPKAVGSNSISISKIQPVSLIDTLHELSHALQAYKALPCCTCCSWIVFSAPLYSLKQAGLQT